MFACILILGTINTGGGGGGRIAVYYSTSGYTGDFTAYGGQSTAGYGGAGTVYESSSTKTKIIVDNRVPHDVPVSVKNLIFHIIHTYVNHNTKTKITVDNGVPHDILVSM